MVKLAIKTIKGGSGGDLPENDVEALLEGVKTCEDIVLIADNFSPMRDFSLIKKIGKPVKVVLCGVRAGINLQYLDLALLREGAIVSIGGKRYQIRKGKFIRLRET